MPIAVTQPTVNTTAGGVLLAQNSTFSSNEGDASTQRFLLKNLGATTIFIGPQGLTSSTGFKWDPADGPLEVELEPGETLYGITSAGSQIVHVLAQGR